MPPQTLEDRVEEYRKFVMGWQGPSIQMTEVTAAMLTWDASKEIAAHSASLVSLTRALTATSVVLAALTAVLVWRTFLG